MYGTKEAICKNDFHFDKVGFEPNDIFLDIGCNIGLIACFVARLFPKITVYGFDASPLAIQYARLNAFQNEVLNTNFFHKAIGANNVNDVKFLSDSVNTTTLIEDSLDCENRSDSYVCDKIAIDEIFDSKLLGIKKVKYLKVDIEGGEFELFKHLFENRLDILKRIEFLHLEIHDLHQFASDKLYKSVKKMFADKLLSAI